MKAHLVDTDIPIKHGDDCKANCGEVVPKAAFVFMWDGESDVASLSISLGKFCRKCAAGRDSCPEGRYVYGIVSGEESIVESLNEQG